MKKEKDVNVKTDSVENETSESAVLSEEQLKIKELETKLEEIKNTYLITLADFDNYRKRKEKEMVESRERAVIDFVISILPAIDNFEMSLKMTENTPMFIKGVEMIHKNLLDTLKEYHFEEFEPKLGEIFDPYKHEPIMIEDHSKEAGRVLAVVKKGYMHKEKIVRPARVNVAKEKDNN